MVHASNPKVGSPIEGLPTLPKEQVRVPVNPVLRLTTNLARLYKLCLLKQEQSKKGVYYSSCIKLIVSIFLVYNVKKCLVKSGKVKTVMKIFLPFEKSFVSCLGMHVSSLRIHVSCLGIYVSGLGTEKMISI